MGYPASPGVLDAFAFLPDVLLAEEELAHRAGPCDRRRRQGDPRSAALISGALAYPLAYKRAEMVGPGRRPTLADPDVDYPDYPEGPAAFACTRNFCSLPVTDAAAIPAQIDAACGGACRSRHPSSERRRGTCSCHCLPHDQIPRRRSG